MSTSAGPPRPGSPPPRRTVGPARPAPATAPPRAPRPVPREPLPPHLYEEERPGFHVSGTELLHLGLSMLALSLVFAFGFTRENALLFDMRAPTTFEVDRALEALPMAAVVVLLGFALHEMAHKVVAQRLALWAEFRASMGGLGAAMGLVLFTGWIFAAPGAVLIVGNATRRDSGLISVAGPMTNLLIAFLFLPLMGTGPNPLEVGQIGDFFQLAVMVNLFLAGFNLLPFPPLDGLKIAKWSIPVYLGMLALLFLLGMFAFGFQL